MSVLQKKKRLYESCSKIRTLRYAYNNGLWGDRSPMGWQLMFEYIRGAREAERSASRDLRRILRKAGKR